MNHTALMKGVAQLQTRKNIRLQLIEYALYIMYYHVYTNNCI